MHYITCGSRNCCNVSAGRVRPEITLRKCVWLRCCYGKKPYGAPPAVPWCNSCSMQIKCAQLTLALHTLSPSGVAFDIS